jgi:hypothetical protein
MSFVNNLPETNHIFNTSVDFDKFFVDNLQNRLSSQELSRSIDLKKIDYDNFQTMFNEIKNNPRNPKYNRYSQIFVASFKLFQRNGVIFSASSFSEGLRYYVPKAEIVSFLDNCGKVRIYNFDIFMTYFNFPQFRIKGKEDIVYYDCFLFFINQERDEILSQIKTLKL